MYRGECRPVLVECEISKGIGIRLVGLPDSSVKEILLNVVTAIQALGYSLPGKRIVINYKDCGRQMARREVYQALGLATALAILIESEQVNVRKETLEDFRFFGALSYDGKISAPYTGITNDNDAAIVVDWYFRNSNLQIMGWPADNTCGWDSADTLLDAITQVKMY